MKEDDYVQMGKFLQNYRCKKGLSQFEVASKIGIDERNYRKGEEGNGIRWISKVIRLERFLGCALSDFFDDQKH